MLPLLLALVLAVPSAQENPADPKRPAFDQVLDLYVRDGLVYYRALKQERLRLDVYVDQIAAVDVERLSRNEQMAFWLNAYDALVLQTVIDHYPIEGKASDYPPHSIRQISGAFERRTHRVANRMITLDQIEQSVLAGFGDPRVFFAIGRGAVGGGRLRSEAFSGARLDSELAGVQAECLLRAVCASVDRENNAVAANAIFSWREKEFVAAYAGTVPARFAGRSPIERAIIGFISPKLLQAERETIDTNTFRMTYVPFDWSLNDLTGRGGR